MSTGNIPRGAPGKQMGPRGLKPMPAGTLKPGGVVFFNVCKKSTKPNSTPMVLKGHGFGVFLGIVPQFGVEPTREMMDPLLAGVGWISFEHVAEFLGEEQFKILETKFREKYGLEEMTEEEAAAEPKPEVPLLTLPPEKPTGLVALDGAPLTKGQEPDA